MGDQTQSGVVYHWKPFIILPFLPPSSNNIYITNWQTKKRIPTKEAAAFKKKVISLVNSECLAEISQLRADDLLVIWYAFYFPREEILNTTFGQKNGAETRYKRMDVENRLKLVTDSIATAIGIDDCQFFEGGHTKLCADLVRGKPQTHVFLKRAEPGRFGL